MLIIVLSLLTFSSIISPSTQTGYGSSNGFGTRILDGQSSGPPLSQAGGYSASQQSYGAAPSSNQGSQASYGDNQGSSGKIFYLPVLSIKAQPSEAIDGGGDGAAAGSYGGSSGGSYGGAPSAYAGAAVSANGYGNQGSGYGLSSGAKDAGTAYGMSVGSQGMDSHYGGPQGSGAMYGGAQGVPQTGYAGPSQGMSFQVSSGSQGSGFYGASNYGGSSGAGSNYGNAAPQMSISSGFGGISGSQAVSGYGGASGYGNSGVQGSDYGSGAVARGTVGTSFGVAQSGGKSYGSSSGSQGFGNGYSEVARDQGGYGQAPAPSGGVTAGPSYDKAPASPKSQDYGTTSSGNDLNGGYGVSKSESGGAVYGGFSTSGPQVGGSQSGYQSQGSFNGPSAVGRSPQVGGGYAGSQQGDGYNGFQRSFGGNQDSFQGQMGVIQGYGGPAGGFNKPHGFGGQDVNKGGANFGSPNHPGTKQPASFGVASGNKDEASHGARPADVYGGAGNPRNGGGQIPYMTTPTSSQQVPSGYGNFGAAFNKVFQQGSVTPSHGQQAGFSQQEYGQYSKNGGVGGGPQGKQDVYNAQQPNFQKPQPSQGNYGVNFNQAAQPTPNKGSPQAPGYGVTGTYNQQQGGFNLAPKPQGPASQPIPQGDYAPQAGAGAGYGVPQNGGPVVKGGAQDSQQGKFGNDYSSQSGKGGISSPGQQTSFTFQPGMQLGQQQYGQVPKPNSQQRPQQGSYGEGSSGSQSGGVSGEVSKGAEIDPQPFLVPKQEGGYSSSSKDTSSQQGQDVYGDTQGRYGGNQGGNGFAKLPVQQNFQSNYGMAQNRAPSGGFGAQRPQSISGGGYNMARGNVQGGGYSKSSGSVGGQMNYGSAQRGQVGMGSQRASYQKSKESFTGKSDSSQGIHSQGHQGNQGGYSQGGFNGGYGVSQNAGGTYGAATGGSSQSIQGSFNGKGGALVGSRGNLGDAKIMGSYGAGSQESGYRSTQGENKPYGIRGGRNWNQDSNYGQAQANIPQQPSAAGLGYSGSHAVSSKTSLRNARAKDSKFAGSGSAKTETRTHEGVIPVIVIRTHSLQGDSSSKKSDGY